MPNAASRHPLDVPTALGRIFHPRLDPAGRRGEPLSTNDAFVAVPDGEKIHLRFFIKDNTAPNLIFFHGNGEIVSDYSDLAPLFMQAGLNCVFVEYRGYGLSTGVPTVSTLYPDCLAAFDFALLELRQRNYGGKILVMGRSLGSACALELAAARKAAVDGLVIESGFAYSLPLLELLGVDASALGVTEEAYFGTLKQIGNWDKPLLVIHAERDRIIPLSDGRALFNAAPSKDKIFLSVPGAGHNDIFAYGMDDYLRELQAFASRLGATP